MLRELRIENLLLIERAELRLGPGLNVITGETGAGKTVLAHSLDLLMGGKPRNSMVRPGAEEAWVEGAFDLPEAIREADDGELAEILERVPAGADEVTLGRRVSAAGRSSAFIAGRAASAQDLALLGDRLLAFYGQHQHRKLTIASAQMDGDAEVLARSVPALAEALEDGSRDDILGELLEAERLGRARKGAIAVLESRIAVRDLHRILSASIPELSERLGSGALDDRLDALLDAERDGRARKGAIAVLDERGRWVAEAGILDGTLADLDEWLQTDRDEDLLTFLRDQEAEGKNRKGALALLDARLA